MHSPCPAAIAPLRSTAVSLLLSLFPPTANRHRHLPLSHHPHFRDRPKHALRKMMRIATSRTCFPSLGVPFPRLSPKSGNRFAEIRSRQTVLPRQNLAFIHSSNRSRPPRAALFRLILQGNSEFSQTCQKSRPGVLDMAEQDVITPLAPGGYILRTVSNDRQASHKPRMPG